MPRSGPVGTYSLPGAQKTQVPDTPILSGVNNQGYADIEQTFNTIQPVAYGGNGVGDGKPLANSFGIRDNADLTKLAIFDVASIPTATTRTYAFPATSGTLALTSQILVERGYLYGLTISNNVTDPTNDIDIAAGEAASDGTIPASMILAASLTKRLDAAWTVGTNQGGLDTGAIANATYHVWLIQRSDTGVVDALFSLSPTAPTMPTNYDRKRRIGAIIRLAGTIVPFTQSDDEFLFATPRGDIDVTNPGISAVTRTLTVPTGIKVGVLTSMMLVVGTSGGVILLATSLDQVDTAPTATVFSMRMDAGSSSIVLGAPFPPIRTNTSAQIRTRLSFSDGNTTLRITTFGWIDRRGK